MFESYDLSVLDWILLALSGLLIGVSKTGLPGFGILIVPLMAMVVPGMKSAGLLLPLLIFADLFAIWVHRRNCLWLHILRTVGPALAGIVAAFILMRAINVAATDPDASARADILMNRIIGGIVLFMLALRWWQTRFLTPDKQDRIPHNLPFALVMGFLAGLTTMLANAAGPVMILYLLAVRLPKTQFVGTSAWFFFIVNWLKVPFHTQLATLTMETFLLDAMLIPTILAGGLLGLVALKLIQQHTFDKLVLILALAAALKLLF